MVSYKEAKSQIVSYILANVKDCDIQSLMNEKIAELEPLIEFDEKNVNDLRNDVAGLIANQFPSLYDWDSGLDN